MPSKILYKNRESRGQLLKKLNFTRIETFLEYCRLDFENFAIVKNCQMLSGVFKKCFDLNYIFLMNW